ncbi:MAG: U32 family peptidase, partial [Clostridia bacterium]|nr:U32 family peptidase [Clostridia bacterium]
MKNYKGEVLAPAGSFDALKAAVNNGADAVYLGAGDFNARVFAKNFSREELCHGVKYAHLRGVKIYITLNTLLFDREKEEFINLIKFLEEIGVDAFIVTDLGAVEIIKENCPQMELHASTQLTCHNLEGVKYLEGVGFSRVVLSRELSFENIKYIVKNTSCEIEVFVHGALCMSYSGQCYLSSVAGERSGNRGKCAQPCRQEYNLMGKKGYFLSLKDNCLLSEVKKLSELGVHSFKIEGRMKRPEYVSSAVRTYKKALETGYELKDEKYLEKVFSRQGFTKGYFENKLSKDMFGVRIGETEKEILDYEKEFLNIEKRREININYSIKNDEKVFAEFSLGELSSKIYGEVPEKAINKAITKADVEKSFSKLGDTAFCLSEISGDLDDGLFIPAGKLNELRREGIKLLEEKILDSFKKLRKPTGITEKVAKEKKTPHFKKVGCFYDINTIDEELLESFDEIFIDFLSAVENFEVFEKLNSKKSLGIRLPRIVKDDMREAFQKDFEKLKSLGIKKVMITNISHLEMIKGEEFEIFSDYSFNITNSEALFFLKKEGIDYGVLSYELSFPRIRDLKKHIPCGVLVYSKLPLMIFENCIIKNNMGCHNGKCEKGEIILSDKMQNRFHLMREYGCKNSLRNEKPIYLGDKEDYKEIGADFFVFDFSVESKNQIKEIMSCYEKGEKAP